MIDTDKAVGIFGEWAPRYEESGWHGVIPLPMKSKAPPPMGTTGATGRFPTREQINEWMHTMGRGNIGVRLGENVIGIDVDAYGAKSGADTLGIATAKWGALPPTWRTTSRTDGTSGIRFYQTPPGLAWPGEVGPGIEIVQFRHRYAVVPPSVHPEGGTYAWLHDDGRGSITPPRVEDLPWLPHAWIDGLTNGMRAVESSRVSMDITGARAWLEERERTSESPCRRMRTTLDTFAATLTTGSAHTAARTLTSQAIRLTDDGHRGALEVLGRAWQAFSDEVTTEGRGMVRSEWEARHEWDSLLSSAVGLVVGDGHDFPVCDCDPQALAEWLGGTEATVHTEAEQPMALTPKASLPELPPLARVEIQQDERDDDWSPVDLLAILNGDYVAPEPSALFRTDGRAMWYPGKVNGLLGASESGKTWVAYLAMRQTLQRGGRVTLIDFEDTPASFVARMDLLGITDEQWEHVSVIAPVSPFTTTSQASLHAHLEDHRPDLIIVDGFNAAMTASGLDLMSNQEVTRFFQVFLTPLAKTGAAVAYIDHVVKNRQDAPPGGIGAQAKRAMTSGCTLMVEVRIQPAPGKLGILDLYVDKDRPGSVREASKASGRGQWAGSITLDSDENRKLDLLFTAPAEEPDIGDDALGVRPMDPQERIRADILKHLAAHGEASGGDIREHVAGRRGLIKAGLEELVAQGVVEVAEHARFHTQVRFKLANVSEITPSVMRDHERPEKPQHAPERPATPEKGHHLTKNESRAINSLHSFIEGEESLAPEHRPTAPAPDEGRGIGAGGRGQSIDSSNDSADPAQKWPEDPFADFDGTPSLAARPPLGAGAGAPDRGSLAAEGPSETSVVCQHCGTVDPKVGYRGQCGSCYNPINGDQWR